MSKVRITTRMILEGLLQVAPQNCPLCDSPVGLVWIGTDARPVTWYFHCTNLKCELEFNLLVQLQPREDIPDT